MAQKTIDIDRPGLCEELFGSGDGNLRLIEQAFDVAIVSRDSRLVINGGEESVEQASQAVEGLFSLIDSGRSLDEQTVRYAVSLAKENLSSALSGIGSDAVCIGAKGKPVRARTIGQQRYIDAMKKNDVTFGIGPAGTGKTYLAVAYAVTRFRAGDVNRIILTRPAVEAGEKLGFLPGDLQHKVDPYLRPLYDALFEMLGSEVFTRLLERGSIEVAPLAYMRGRTLDDSFIILDEAQNTTREQMKMFLTRLGNGSKMVVTGDVTQIDLPEGRRSGLVEAAAILKNIDGIAVTRFTQRDVVRHRLVQDIITAYEKNEEGKKHGSKDQGGH
ncbi:MAG: PhoH family protein [Clostridia bacterium]|nr:PhoH family protein [Clostridia bacterium]